MALPEPIPVAAERRREFAVISGVYASFPSIIAPLLAVKFTF